VRITAANKDALREKCFALHAQGLSYVEIASRLGIGSKNTVMKYVHQEARRRRYDPEAKEVLERTITSLRQRADDLERRYEEIEGNAPRSQAERHKNAQELHRLRRTLLALYGVELPETDAERILEERGRKMDQVLLEPDGYPELSEQAIVDRHVEELDRQFVERFGHHLLGKRPTPAPTKPTPTEEDSSDRDDADVFMAENWNEGYSDSYEGY
jgi:transposase-like protein